jgi:hypothetical protein
MVTNPVVKQHDAERRKKALAYTTGICGVLLILFFLISWKVMPPSVAKAEDLIEINLGNYEEGMGTIQPLVKGERGESREKIETPVASYSKEEPGDKVTPDENAEEEAAAVNKPVKSNDKIKTQKPADAVVTVPKPQKPKVTYDGPGKGTGNNDTEDNGYKYQGNKAGGTGDAGDPNGHKDSYGSSPGGRIGGGPLVRGNRKIIRHYAFTGDLKKATIYALVRVSPAGTGTFVGFDKGSTSRSPEYASAISNYLRNIQFDKSTQESRVQVQFNFNEN